MVRLARVTHALVALTLTVGMASAETLWNEFRGPTGQGHSTAVGLPLEWGPQKNIVWRTALPGQAWSSAIVANGKIFLTNAAPLNGNDPEAGVALQVLALNAATGKELWTRDVFKLTDPEALRKHDKNSHASPTPIWENGRIYAHFGHHGTACVDETGKILWSTQENKYVPVHGTGGSPVIVDDLLIFNVDGASDPGVLALDKATGKVRWKVLRPPTPANKFSFSTPLVITVNGQRQLITLGSGIGQALNPKDGSEIWHVLYGTGFSVVPRPVFAHGLLFFGTGYGKPVGYAVRPDGKGDVTATHVAWTSNKRVPLNPSMLVVGDELYMLSDGGILTCMDAKSGTVYYEERLVGSSSASLLFGDGRIYAIDEQGKAGVVKPGKTFELLATNDLQERTLASMSVCDNDLLIRTEKALYRVGKGGAQQ